MQASAALRCLADRVLATEVTMTQKKKRAVRRSGTPRVPRQNTTSRAVSPASVEGAQHYATFMLELLLDESSNVMRTRLSHVQSGDEHTVAGWDAQEVLTWMDTHSGARLVEVLNEVSAE